MEKKSKENKSEKKYIVLVPFYCEKRYEVGETIGELPFLKELLEREFIKIKE